MRRSVRAARVGIVAAMSLLPLAGVATPASALLGADVSIEVSASPDPVEVGQDLTITVTVRNQGGADASGVVVTDVLVSSLTLTSAVPSLGSCSGTTAVVCTIGTMTPSQIVVITMHVTPNLEGAVANTAVATALLDLNLVNNTAITTVDVFPAGGGGGGGGTTEMADLGLTMAATPDPGTVGLALTYEMTVTNAGPDAAEDVTLIDSLPIGATFTGASADQGSCSGTGPVTCDLGTLASGASRTVTVGVVPILAGLISNSAAVLSSKLDPNPLDNQALKSITVAATGGGTSGSCTISGTEGDDVLRGTPGKDVICGLGGSDTLIGLGGNDVLKGGEGNDTLSGGGGKDRLLAGAGNDTMKGAGGRDVLKGGSGLDWFSGGIGRDRCGNRKQEIAKGCE